MYTAAGRKLILFLKQAADVLICTSIFIIKQQTVKQLSELKTQLISISIITENSIAHHHLI
jgi:hypothetical protein